MKLSTEFLASVVEGKKPVDKIGDHLLELWLAAAEETDNTGDFYYQGEAKAWAYEDFILKAYPEFYNLLARECVGECGLEEQADTGLVIMDGMSLREGVLIYNALRHSSYDATLGLSLSAIPSDTIAFREKLKIPRGSFRELNNPRNISIGSDEKRIWSYFPDVLLDKIQVGRTVISSLEEMYEVILGIVHELINRLNTSKIVITSDHGYIRSESGFVFGVPDNVKAKLQNTFGSARYIQMNDVDVITLVKQGYVEEFAGYYLAKSRYMWPVRGKYSIYLHGGLSLMECFTPVIEVRK